MPEQVRKFFTAVQEVTESGGQQLDSQGKPLVGRYRDGTTPKPGQEAYGAGQMQIRTAKNVARSRGIPWDQNKFMYNKDYNLTLADAHMEDLTRKYGDQTLARAAYHSGEPKVDRAIAKYGRAGFAQGLGPEGRRYIQMGSPDKNVGAGGGYNSTFPGHGVANPYVYLQGLQSALGPEAKASENVKQPAAAIFGSDQELKTRADAVEGQIVAQGAQLQVLGQVMEVAQAGAREAMTRQIDQTRGISEEIVAGTQALKRQVTPVFQARGRVADQLDKLATMNPLERSLRGVFDLNYDRDYLTGQLDQFDRTLKARADDFDYVNRLHNVALQEVNRRYNLDTGMPELLQKQAEEDLGVVGMRITQTSAMLGNLKDRIGTESQLIAAKNSARQDLLGRLDIPTVTDLMTQAQTAGGVVHYNGVDFSYKELRDRVQVGEQQVLQIEAAKMSIASGRMDMADKYASNLAESLTRGQLEAAIANGGVHAGIQLNQGQLAILYQSAIGRDTQIADSAAKNMPASVALQAGSDYLNQAHGLFTRGASLFGNEAMSGSTTYLNQGTSLVQRLIAATKTPGTPPEVITQLTAQIAQNSADYAKHVDEVILRRTGGDKVAADYMKGFVYGTPLDEGAAVNAMTYFATKGSLPTGVNLSPAAKQVFARASALVEQHRTDKVDGRTIGQEQLQQIVARELTQSAARIVGQSRHEDVWSDLPKLANQTGHEFGKLDPQTWLELRNQASRSGAEAIARQVKTTPENVQTMMDTGKPLPNSGEAGKQLYESLKSNMGTYNAQEMQTLTRLLDLEPQLVPGKSNSGLLHEFLGSANLSRGLSTYQQNLGAQSLGEYLLNPMTRGATESNLGRTRQAVGDARTQVNQSRRQLAQNPELSMLLQPVSRTSMILSSIPGIDGDGTRALQPFVKEFFSRYVTQGRGDLVESPNAQFVREDNALRDAFAAVKFPDPKMETYRKLAVSKWNEHATAHQGFFQRAMEGLQFYSASANSALPVDSVYGQDRGR